MTPQQPNLPPHVQAQIARQQVERELKALQGQQSIAEFGITALSNVAAELSGNSRDAEILRDAAREMETGILRALPGEESAPDRAADLRRIADRLQQLDAVGDTCLRVMLSAMLALCSLRLSELQTAHSANAERIAQLEGFLAKADSRIAIPNLQV